MNAQELKTLQDMIQVGHSVWVTVWWIDGCNEYRYRTVKRQLRQHGTAGLTIRCFGGVVPVTVNQQRTLITACLDDGWEATP